MFFMQRIRLEARMRIKTSESIQDLAYDQETL